MLTCRSVCSYAARAIMKTHRMILQKRSTKLGCNHCHGVECNLYARCSLSNDAGDQGNERESCTRGTQNCKESVKEDIDEMKAQRPSYGQLHLKRRRFMTPGSRLASVLPQQYWQHAGEDQEVIEKVAGEVHHDSKLGTQENKHDCGVTLHLTVQDSASGMDEGGELQCKSMSTPQVNNVNLMRPDTLVKSIEKHSRFTSKLTGRGGLNVSSRLEQMMEMSATSDEKSEDISTTGDCCSDPQKVKKEK